ncbi:MAG TPA: hypothetical protein VI542_13165 [Candidatus Tectomicrobia bacterium]
MKRIQHSIAALLASGALFLSLVGPVAAQVQIPDGLVNVTIGDIEVLNNANIGIAAEVAAQVCGIRVSHVAVLAEQVDNGGATRTICTSPQRVTISQN